MPTYHVTYSTGNKQIVEVPKKDLLLDAIAKQFQLEPGSFGILSYEPVFEDWVNVPNVDNLPDTCKLQVVRKGETVLRKMVQSLKDFKKTIIESISNEEKSSDPNAKAKIEKLQTLIRGVQKKIDAFEVIYGKWVQIRAETVKQLTTIASTMEKRELAGNITNVGSASIGVVAGSLAALSIPLPVLWPFAIAAGITAGATGVGSAAYGLTKLGFDKAGCEEAQKLFEVDKMTTTELYDCLEELDIFPDDLTADGWTSSSLVEALVQGGKGTTLAATGIGKAVKEISSGAWNIGRRMASFTIVLGVMDIKDVVLSSVKLYQGSKHEAATKLYGAVEELNKQSKEIRDIRDELQQAWA